MAERTHIPILRPKPLKSKGKGLRRASKKRGKANAEYLELRKGFLEQNPYCQWFMQENGISEEVAAANIGLVLVNHPVWGWKHIHVPRATQVHHKKGRVGNLLIDIRYWMAVSHEAHEHIHRFPKESYEKLYMLKR